MIEKFPNTLNNPFIETSDATNTYNCIAWAYGDNTKWYWPDIYSYWPPNISSVIDLDSFIDLFGSIGYTKCNNGNLEDGYLKIVIFEKNGKPTHAARQLKDGLWTSKLGQYIDVSHTIEAMNGGFYGNALVYMRRPIKKQE